MSFVSRPGRTAGAVTGEILDRLERFGVKLGLETTRRLLTGLGSPQGRYPTVLVAGTNGKGSTAALLASMATAAGYRTGLFTSPHLESVRERLRIDGRGIGFDELDRLLARVVDQGERCLGHAPSYFEALCVSALAWFAEREVDLAVLEVGLGGRLDATNVCEPRLSVITSLGLDHQEVLGHAIEQIAREKAGILRADGIAITAATGEGLMELRRCAEELGVSLQELDQELRIISASVTAERQVAEVVAEEKRARLEFGLPGAHQRRNAALAVLAAWNLADLGYERLSRSAIERGAAACRWPGRLERIPLPGGRQVMLDSAHNPAGATALAEYLRRQATPPVLVFGALKKKNSAAMLEALAPVADRVILTRPPSGRAAAPSGFHLPDAGSFEVEEDPARALDRVLAVGPRVVVCGSIYLVGEIRCLLRRRHGIPAPAIDLL